MVGRRGWFLGGRLVGELVNGMHFETYFKEEVRARVAGAVRKAEARSRGQIVPVVVERSDSYPEVRFRGGLLFAALLTALVLALRLPIGTSELVLLQVLFGGLGALLTFLGPVERMLAGRRALEEAVRARAVRAFQEEGLHKTSEGTGVLLFASLFERRAVVLGDYGIHEKVGDEAWDWRRPRSFPACRRATPGRGSWTRWSSVASGWPSTSKGIPPKAP